MLRPREPIVQVRAIARKTAKTTAKRMLYNYMGKVRF